VKVRDVVARALLVEFQTEQNNLGMTNSRSATLSQAPIKVEINCRKPSKVYRTLSTSRNGTRSRSHSYVLLIFLDTSIRLFQPLSFSCRDIARISGQIVIDKKLWTIRSFQASYRRSPDGRWDVGDRVILLIAPETPLGSVLHSSFFCRDVAPIFAHTIPLKRKR
jgi:hypothetical protein